MAGEVSFDGPSEDLDVFECPKCGETIGTSADVCRFCGAKVDHEAAKNAAHLLARVDQACSDASNLRNTAAIAFTLAVGALFVILRGNRSPSLFHWFGSQNVLMGYAALVLVVSSPFPLWSLRWWGKHAKLQSDDEELQSARTTVRSTGFAASAAFVASGVIICLILVLRATHG